MPDKKVVNSETIHCDKKNKDVIIVVYDDGTTKCKYHASNVISDSDCQNCPHW